MEWNFDIWTLLLLFGIFQGIYLIPFTIQKGRLPGRLLAFLIFIIIFNLFNYLVINIGLYHQIPFLLVIPQPFLFLIGPVYFYYTRAIVNDIHWKWLDVLHLLPFLLAIIYHSSFYLLSGGQKIAIITTILSQEIHPGSNVIFYVAFHTIQTLVYLNLSDLILKKKGPYLKQKQRRWLQVFNRLFGGFWIVTLIWVAYLIVGDKFFHESDYIVMLAASVFLIIIGYHALYNQAVFLKYGVGESRLKYQNSTISEEQAIALLKRLIRYMEEEKPFLESDLKMSHLANTLGTSTNILSQILNQQLNKNFYEFLNEYRITEAIKKLSDPKFNHYTIIGIAMDSGFNNKNTFNRLFKKHTGITPGQYMKQNVNTLISPRK